jgi:D-lyxose ketol-isomerase
MVNPPFDVQFWICGFFERKHQTCYEHRHESEEESQISGPGGPIVITGLTSYFHFDTRKKGLARGHLRGKLKIKLTLRARV